MEIDVTKRTCTISSPALTLLAGLSLFLSSCSGLLTSTVIEPAVGNLQYQTDIELVCDGSPAFLLMVDSMLVNSPENRDLLLVATKSYSGYATALAECDATSERTAVIAKKARDYGFRLLQPYLGSVSTFTGPEFDNTLRSLKKNAVEPVFWGTFGWLTWVSNEKGSPAAIADIIHIEKIMARLLELDEAYNAGAIHLFFGTYYAAKPQMFGGRPDLAKIHFERALELSQGKFLLVQTTYAETLARSSFDKELHNRLLKEVLEFPLDSAPEYGLSNSIAIKRAKRLMADDYFAE